MHEKLTLLLYSMQALQCGAYRSSAVGVADVDNRKAAAVLKAGRSSDSDAAPAAAACCPSKRTSTVLLRTLSCQHLKGILR